MRCMKRASRHSLLTVQRRGAAIMTRVTSTVNSHRLVDVALSRATPSLASYHCNQRYCPDGDSRSLMPATQKTFHMATFQNRRRQPWFHPLRELWLCAANADGPRDKANTSLRSRNFALQIGIIQRPYFSVNFAHFPAYATTIPEEYRTLILLLVNTCLLDKISKLEAIPIKYHNPLGKNEANHDAFVAFVLAYRITQISHDRGNLAQPSEAYHTKHLWERLYTCISNQIGHINREIAQMNPSYDARNRILARIQGIKCVELMLQSPIWRHHTEGFLSLLRFCGGAKFAQGRPALIRNSKGIIM